MLGDTAVTVRAQRVDRIRELQRTRNEYANKLDEVRAKIARADERRRTDRANERKWNRVLDQLESSMDDLKSAIAACEGELTQLRKLQSPGEDEVQSLSPPPSTPEERNEKASELLHRAESHDAAKIRSGLEKTYSGRAHETTLDEAFALLDEFERLHARSDLSGVEAKRADAIRTALPVIAERMKEWQVRWSHVAR
jgi:chromosome segregation ATPase